MKGEEHTHARRPGDTEAVQQGRNSVAWVAHAYAFLGVIALPPLFAANTPPVRAKTSAMKAITVDGVRCLPTRWNIGYLSSCRTKGTYAPRLVLCCAPEGRG